MKYKCRQRVGRRPKIIYILGSFLLFCYVRNMYCQWQSATKYKIKIAQYIKNAEASSKTWYYLSDAIHQIV